MKPIWRQDHSNSYIYCCYPGLDHGCGLLWHNCACSKSCVICVMHCNLIKYDCICFVNLETDPTLLNIRDSEKLQVMTWWKAKQAAWKVKWAFRVITEPVHKVHNFYQLQQNLNSDQMSELRGGVGSGHFSSFPPALASPALLSALQLTHSTLYIVSSG